MAHDTRLAFGDVSELYDQARPSYPPGLVEDVLAFAVAAEADQALEVGAGTGKATALADVRYVHARRALADEGAIALFWNRPRWESCGLREQLADAYRRAAPELGSGGAGPGPMHPAVEKPPRWWADRLDELNRDRALTRPKPAPTHGSSATGPTSTCNCCKPIRTTSCSRITGARRCSAPWKTS
jgi:hypothetical protein